MSILLERKEAIVELFQSGRGFRVVLLVSAVTWGGSLQAQPCLQIPLLGLPRSVESGERIRVTAELTTACNLKVVDRATLICRFPDRPEVRRDVDLYAQRDYMQAEVVFEMPEVDRFVTADCHIEFTQCNERARTCAVEVEITAPVQPSDPVQPANPAPPSVRDPRPPPGPRRLPPPPPTPRPRSPSTPTTTAPSSGGSGGTFFKGLGWLGVAVGLAAYAEAGSLEQEGRLEEAQDSEELGNQVLVASGVLLLLGYGMDGAGFASDGDPPPPRRIRPMLAVDPVNRAVYVQVSLTFD